MPGSALDPQPGQVWRPTRDVERTKPRSVVALEADAYGDPRVRYRSVWDGGWLGKYKFCAPDAWVAWVYKYAALPDGMDALDARPPKPPSVAALRRAVIDAARVWVHAPAGQHQTAWKYQVLADAVRALDAAETPDA